MNLRITKVIIITANAITVITITRIYLVSENNNKNVINLTVQYFTFSVVHKATLYLNI